MKTADLDYDLPPELIAQHPAARRDESRLLVYDRASGEVRHRVFSDLPGELPPQALAVVNEVFTQTYFGSENPIGRHFGLGGSAPVDFEIIGVSKTARYSSLKRDIPPVAYVPYSQNLRNLNQMTYELRASGGPLGLARAVRQVVQQPFVFGLNK